MSRGKNGGQKIVASYSLGIGAPCRPRVSNPGSKGRIDGTTVGTPERRCWTAVVSVCFIVLAWRAIGTILNAVEATPQLRPK